MAGLLRNVPLSDGQREAHDTHRTAVVAAVAAVLCVYVYLFTFAARDLGLPTPERLARSVGITASHVFDDFGNVDAGVTIRFADRFDTDAEDMLAFLGILLAAFLSAYYLPLRYKQGALSIWTAVALALLYGPRVLAGLLCAHVVAYLVLHPTRRVGLALLPGVLGAFAFLPDRAALVWALPAGLASAATYRYALGPLLQRPRAAALLRTLVSQSALIAVVGLGLTEGLGGSEIILQLGVLLFFWQWSRQILYHVDYKDGNVPLDTPLTRYLAVFLSPGVVPSWDWGVELGLGYAYTHNSFLCEDKNKTVLAGVRILGVALIYLIAGDWLVYGAADALTALEVDVYDTYLTHMVAEFMGGADVAPLSVLCTSLLDTVRWTVWFVGIVHFKVGVWRICGYRLEPYFNRPWLATNLVNFWARYVLYYREFLIKAFYFPVFFRFFKKQRRTRIVVATVAAAGVGNLVWGHFPESAYERGLTWEALGYVLHTWPYYVLLSLGIGLTDLYLLKRRRRRRPWTPGPRVALDVLASYATIQYFAIIHIFARPAAGSTEWDLLRLFLRAFRIFLD